MPYEDLAVQLGEFEPLDSDRLVDRVCQGGRGGYCFELNTVLGALLEALGFTVWRHRAVVGERGGGDPVNHLALAVEADGRLWLADAGLGEGPLDPLPLEPGEHGPAPMTWAIEREPGGWWVAAHEWSSFPGVAIDGERVGLDAFAGPHERLSTDPASSFVQTLIAQRPFDDRIVTLRARTLSVAGPSHDERRVLADAGELARALRDVFGIEPLALGTARLARLWDQACEQHEAWLRREALRT